VIAIWAAFDNRIAIISALASLLLGFLIIYKAREEITFDGKELRVGRAHIETQYCGEVTVLNGKEFLNARTRGVDPAAHLALLFWVSEGVKIEINDSRDPTPYWLISTRRGKDLKQALAR
jgi:hypothetical protein